MALLSGVVVLAMPDGADGLEREAERFAARLKMAAQESVITGETIGVVLQPEGYAFERRRAGVWTPIGSRDGFFGPQPWDAATLVSWRREGGARRALAEVGPGADDEGQEASKGARFRFDGTGEATPFEVILERDGERYEVTSTALGEIGLAGGRI